MKITYPFEFHELLLTSKVLDVLGFSEYWGDCGESGTRTLNLGGKVGDERLVSKKEYPLYHIHEIDETPDPESGYGYGPPMYSSCHFTDKNFSPIYFLHDMYEDIVARRTPEEITRFIELTKKKGINMYPYIEQYLNYKNKQNGEGN